MGESYGFSVWLTGCLLARDDLLICPAKRWAAEDPLWCGYAVYYYDGSASRCLSFITALQLLGCANSVKQTGMGTHQFERGCWLVGSYLQIKKSCSFGAVLRAWMQQKNSHVIAPTEWPLGDNRSSSRPPLHEAGFHLLMSKPPIFQPLISAALRAVCVSSASHHHRGLGLLPLL